jgi:ring-1,2-phenylacetyl-CoA epoxidase subunit PaaC
MKRLYEYLLILGDSPLILGHRLSELTGHGPNLETDIAIGNIALDLLGQVRNWFQYAAEVQGEGKTEDDITFLRYEHEYRCVLLTEQPNKDFAWVIARQFYFDAWHHALLEKLSDSKDERIAAIATKSLKEVAYHRRFSSEWVKRLGDGTEESRRRMTDAIQHFSRYTGELFEESAVELEMADAGIGARPSLILADFQSYTNEVLQEAGLEIPSYEWSQSGGKKGVHSEHLGYILAELQYMQRAYPGMQW